jgi:predicted ATPase/DNA-binding winged helix-turn-helix (wHTH) protein
MKARSQEPSTSESLPHDTSLAGDEVRLRFGSFTLWETQRRLERHGQAVRLGARSFDLLLHLVTRAGELVSKDELLAAVWTGLVVEEGSVRVHMSLLRKALGKPEASDGCREWITTIPQRGYRFNGKVVRGQPDDTSSSAASPATLFASLPVRLTELVGRDVDIDRVIEAFGNHRLVTIVGPGGIGKTSVAIAAAARRQELTPAVRVAFTDLAPLISPDHVVGAIARSVGVAADLPDPVDVITQQLGGADAGLLIDNCEHVLDSLASPITRLLTAIPGLRILATSREPLRVPGECVLRLAPLAVPDAKRLTLEQALDCPSVKLLVERARDAGAGIFNESDCPALAKLSRQLDGIPLAIELVAARLGVQSVQDLTLRLDERLLSLGNRTAIERHKSLAAALDWSIALLSDEELRTFRRLSLFRGRFDVDSAIAVSACDMQPDAVFDALISLANKSLVSFDGNDSIAPYRLLDTTRSHAAALLAESGERPALVRRYVLLVLDLMKTATAQLPNRGRLEWNDRYTHYLNDVRFALKICLAEQPDAKTAVGLIMASAPRWFILSQVVEYCEAVEEALALVKRQPEPDPEATASLLTKLVIALPHTALDANLDAACDQAIAGAIASKSRVLELQARWGQCMYNVYRGQYATALRQSQVLLEVVQSWPADPASLHLAHRMHAYAGFYCGQFDAARKHCLESLRISRTLRRTRAHMVGVEPTVSALTLLSLVLWIRGESARALKTARNAVHRAETIGHAASLCVALYGGCAVALWSGEFKLAEAWVGLMTGEARRTGLVRWLHYAEWFAQGLKLSIDDETGAYARKVLDQISTYDAPRKEMLVTFSTNWIDDAMIARVVSGEGLWSASEVWRAAGQRSEQAGKLDEAEQFYRRALETAREQDAKAWEQRAALSLAGMWSRRGQPRQAIRLLDDTFGNNAAMSGFGNPAITQAEALRKEIAALQATVDAVSRKTRVKKTRTARRG